MSLKRITITIPDDLVDAADREAAAQDRSRSWVLVEALRAYLRRGAPAEAVREPAGPYVAGLGPQRQAQLAADLALSPEERVRLAEETAREAELRSLAPTPDRVIAFERLEDFHAWERHEALAR